MSLHWIHTSEAKKTATAIGVVSVVALCSYAAWKAFGKGCGSGEHKNSAKKEGKHRRFLKDQEYWASVNAIKAAASEDIKHGRVSKNLVIGVGKAMGRLVEQEYLANVIENRKMRRNMMANIGQFTQELLKGNKVNEKLLEDVEREVLRDIGVDYTFYHNQTKAMYQDDPNVACMSIFMLESLKSKLPTVAKDLKKETLVAYFALQTENFDKYNFQDMGLAPDTLIVCKQAFMSDLACIQLKIEEEDLINNKALLGQPEVQEAHRKLEEKVYEETQKANRFSY